MIALSKLLTKVVNDVNNITNYSVPAIEVEQAAAAIDDYLGLVWNEFLEANSPWRVILDAFHRTYEDEPDHAVTFTAYVILTQCMLKDKLDAIRTKP